MATEEIMCDGHFEKLTARYGMGYYILEFPRREGQIRLRESYEEERRWYQEL
jgi:hypothetical protein